AIVRISVFFQAEDGIRDRNVTGVQTCALPISLSYEQDVGTAMDRIESEAKRMTQLVEDLLTLARLDEHRTIDYQPIDLFGLASDLVVDTRATAPDRNITLTGLDGVSSPQPAPTIGDSDRLRQVISNLMTNVLRYTP